MATYIKIGSVYYLEEDIHKIFKPRIAWTTEHPGKDTETIKEFACKENCPVE
jgi:hypothetical protein